MKKSIPILILYLLTNFHSALCQVRPDSTGIRQHIESQYVQVDSVFDDALNEVKVYRFNAGIIMDSLHLNGDRWIDYFVITDYMGGPTHGIFHDGRTGEPFEFIPQHILIWSRPGVDIEHQVINVNCDDNTQEMLIRYGSGGTIGSYYTTQVYRYDKDSDKVKLIFDEPISVMNWNDAVEGGEMAETVNYIDINYLSEECIDTIVVKAGKFIGDPDSDYTLSIEPKPAGYTHTYIFRKATNMFVATD